VASAREAQGRLAASIGTIMNWAAPANTSTLAKTASHQGAPACTNKKPNTMPSGT
jgi:transposase